MAKSFADQVGAFVAKSDAMMRAVYQESAQEVIEEAQRPKSKGGNMPVKDGFLRNSGQATLNAPSSETTKKPKNYSGVDWDAGEVVLVINKAELKDTIYFTWTAEYAARMEYGFVGKDSLGRQYNQPGNGFLRLAAQQWPQIVKKVAARAEKAYKVSRGQM